jgi:uncharacterized protein YeaO (DUF488 family)
MHDVSLRRIYEPAPSGEGCRVLVDALWPRGVKREADTLDLWLKAVAPSTELRRWFNHDVGRWPAFRKRYEEELRQPERAAAVDQLKALANAGPLTLLYAARDTEHNNAVVLKAILTG